MANRRDFQSFVSKVGAAAAAKRLGISEKTLAGWASRGVPAQRVADVTGILKRHQASVQAEKTKQHDREFREREWRELVRLPPGQKRGENLTDEQRIPRRDPRTDAHPKAKRLREKLAKQTGWAESLSTGWVLMSSPFQKVDMDIKDFEQHAAAYGERAVELWRQIDPQRAPKNSALWFNLQLARYFPDNPAYYGKVGLESKIGHWIPMREVSSQPARTEGTAVRLPDEIISAQNKINRRGPREQTIGALIDDANARNFWVMGFRVVVGLERPPVDLTEIVTGKERRPRPKRPPKGRKKR